MQRQMWELRLGGGKKKCGMKGVELERRSGCERVVINKYEQARVLEAYESMAITKHEMAFNARVLERTTLRYRVMATSSASTLEQPPS